MKAAQAITLYYKHIPDGIMLLRIEGRASSVVIPEIIDNKMVTAIAPFAFAIEEELPLSDEESLAAFTFIQDDTLLLAPICASEGAALKHLHLPDSIHTIGEYAFAGCRHLERVHLPASLRTLSDHLFSDCSALEKLYLPSELTYIDPYAFYNCQRLSSLALPETLLSIKRYAFYNCRLLTTINIPKNTFHLETGIFLNCDSLHDLHFGKCRHVSDIISGLNHELLLTIDFPDGRAKLLIPDFQYEYIEDTPARMLHTVNYGTGHLFRQSIGNYDIDFRRYDELFYLTRREDAAELVLLLVVCRLSHPYRLPDEHQENYVSYVREHFIWAAEYYIRKKDLDTIRLFAKLGLLSQTHLPELLQKAQKHHAASIISFLMDYQHKHSNRTSAKKTFDL